MWKNSHFPKVLLWTARAGLVGACVILLGVCITALFYGGRDGEPYAFRNHFVSELGERAYSDLAWVFNITLLIGGLLLTAFMLGLAVLMRHWFSWLFGGLALLTGIPGALVGVFPMDSLGPHIQVAMMFFNTGMVTMLVFSLFVLLVRRPYFPRWLAIPGFLNAGFFLLFLNMPTALEEAANLETATLALLNNRPDVLPLAIFEWAVVFGVMAWALLTGATLTRFSQAETANAEGLSRFVIPLLTL
jgi:hypothetical membrane protein